MKRTCLFLLLCLGMGYSQTTHLSSLPGKRMMTDHFEIIAGQAAGAAAPQSASSNTTSGAAAPQSASAGAVPDASAAAAVAVTKPAAPDPNELTPDEVQRALNGEGKDHWIHIEDMGLMAAQGNQVPSLSLFMPEAVLFTRKEGAKKQFLQYEPTPEDKKRAMMIVAHGYAGKTISEGCTSITRIVLVSDEGGGVVKEAYMSEPLGETWRNGLGATAHCQALRAKFLLDDVKQVKAAAAGGEFYVAVFAGSVKTKTYKIKKKHQEKLGLP